MSTPRILQITARIFVAAFAFMAFAGTALAQGEPSLGPFSKGKPTEPTWGYWPKLPDAWQATHKGFVAQAKKGGVNVLFLGDSITKGWAGAGKDIWEKTYKPLGAANFGMGGDGTRQILWRIDNGTVDGITPKLVVLMIGTNNLYDDQNSGTNEEIAAGVEKIVTQLHAKLPETKVLLLGILPREDGKFGTRIVAVNGIVSKLDNGKTVRFLDLTNQFQQADGKVLPSLYTNDLVHLQTAGYEVLSAAIQPLVEQMIK